MGHTILFQKRCRPCHHCGVSLCQTEGIEIEIGNKYRIYHIECMDSIVKQAYEIRSKRKSS